MTSIDASQQCRLYLAALFVRGFSLKELAKGLHVGRRMLQKIWLSTEYLPQASDVNSELGSFISTHPDLPSTRELTVEGQELEKRMGVEVWNDPAKRDAWITANAS